LLRGLEGLLLDPARDEAVDVRALLAAAEDDPGFLVLHQDHRDLVDRFPFFPGVDFAEDDGDGAVPDEPRLREIRLEEQFLAAALAEARIAGETGPAAEILLVALRVPA